VINEMETVRNIASSTVLAEADNLISTGLLTDASEVLEVYLIDHADDTPVLRKLAHVRMLQDRPDDAADLLLNVLAIVRNAMYPKQTQENLSLQATHTARRFHDNSAIEHSDQDYLYVDQQARDIEAKRERYDYVSDHTTSENISRPETLPNSDDSVIENDDLNEKTFLPDAEFQSDRNDTQASCSPDPSLETLGNEHAPGTELQDDESEPESLEVEEFSELPELVDADGLGEDSGKLAKVYEKEGDKRSAEISQDWEAIDPYLLDYDEEPVNEEPDQDIQTDGTIGRRQRALQEAIKLGTQYGWDDSDIYILAEVFEKYWWSSAKRSMVRELEAGLLPEELRLALTTRDIWQQYDEFSINLSGYPYPALSWSLAIKIVRSFHSYPGPEEIEYFLLEAYSEWRSRSSLADRHQSFVDYLISRLSFPNDQFMISPSVTLDIDYDWSSDDYLPGRFDDLNTPHYQDLVEYGLIPDIWVDPNAIVIRSSKNEQTTEDEVESGDE
jgi:hypothetical protein